MFIQEHESLPLWLRGKRIFHDNNKKESTASIKASK